MEFQIALPIKIKNIFYWVERNYKLVFAYEIVTFEWKLKFLDLKENYKLRVNYKVGWNYKIKNNK